jgi:hypothetical protein
MRVEFPEAAHAETLIAVGVGAVLATIGGFIATLIEARLHERRRERTAALTFGEILASISLLVRAVTSAHGVGDPFGPLTLRLLRSARREVEAYERSRPALSDLRSTDLRLEIHAVMIRLTLAIDGVLEAPLPADQQRAYEFLLLLGQKIDPLVRRLVPVAGQPIEPYEERLTHGPEGRPDAEPAPTAG